MYKLATHMRHPMLLKVNPMSLILLFQDARTCSVGNKGQAGSQTSTCRRVCSTHLLRLLISACVKPKRLMFFSATSTAFSISSTWVLTGA